jgi:tRNA(Ile)-lysidine synthase
MPKNLLIRNWIKGDKLTPFGFDGTVKVSDLLTNMKIDNIKKEKLLVMTDKVNIVWVLGVRMSDKYAVKKDSTKVMKIELLESPLNN